MLIQRSLLLTLCFVCSSAVAQVNTEQMRTGAGDAGFHGFIDGTYTLKSGNVDLMQVGAGLRLEYLQGKHRPFVQGNILYGQKSDETYINRGFVHLRWTAMWHKYVGSEVFGQLQFSEFKRLKLRRLVGAGLRTALWLSRAFEMYLGTGYMIEHEQLELDSTAVHPKEVLHHRWTSYFTLRFNIGKSVALANTIYLQPRIDAFSDLRVLEEGALEIKLMDSLTLVEALVVTHDSAPPDGVEKTDISTKTSLRVTF